MRCRCPFRPACVFILAAPLTLVGCGGDEDASGLQPSALGAAPRSMTPARPESTATVDPPAPPAAIPASSARPAGPASDYLAAEFLLSASEIPFQVHRAAGADVWTVIWSANDRTTFPVADRSRHTNPQAEPAIRRGDKLVAINGGPVTARRHDRLLRHVGQALADRGTVALTFERPGGSTVQWVYQGPPVPIDRVRFQRCAAADAATPDLDALGPQYREILEHVFAGRVRAARALLGSFEYDAAEQYNPNRYIAESLVILAASEGLGADLYDKVAEYASENHLQRWFELVRTAAEFDPTAPDRAARLTAALALQRVQSRIHDTGFRPFGDAYPTWEDLAIIEAMTAAGDDVTPDGVLATADCLMALAESCFDRDEPALGTVILFWVERGTRKILPNDYVQFHRRPGVWQERLLDHCIALMEAGDAAEAARVFKTYAQEWPSHLSRFWWDDIARIGEVMYELEQAGQRTIIREMVENGGDYAKAYHAAAARARGESYSISNAGS